MNLPKKIFLVTNIVPHYNHEFLNSVTALCKQDFQLFVWVEEHKKNSLHTIRKGIMYKLNECQTFSFFGLSFRPGLFWKILTHKPEKIVFYGNPRDLSVITCLLLARILKITTYTYGMFHRVGRMKLSTRLIYRIFACLSTRCLTYGTKGANVLYAQGIKKEKIKIVGTALQIEGYNKERDLWLQSHIDHAKKKLELENKILILQVVRFSRIKNIHLLIEAAKLLKDRGYSFKFILIGEGETYQDMRCLIQRLQLETEFLLLGAIYDEPVLAKWFNIADICVVPSSIGLSLHHAFAYGKPIVTDDCIETQSSEFELLIDGFNGSTYKAGNYHDLADTILTITSNKIKLKNMALNCLETFEFNSISKKASNFLNAIDIDTEYDSRR